MKKTFLLLSLALVAFSSCQKEAKVGGTTLTATIEQQVETNQTKTYLDGGVVKWSTGDAVKVFYSEGDAYQFDLKSGEGTTTATFKYDGSTSGDPQYAIYPYSDATISGSTITFTLPATQTYAANSFGNGANVAVAQVSKSGMEFKNVCGSFKLQLKGSMCVKTIELTGKNYEKLNGTFSVDVLTAGTTGAAPVGTPVEAEEKLTLDCGEGVQLDSETPTSFYFVVPVSALASGFDAKIIDVAGNTYFTTLSSDKANTINRSKVRAMDSRAVSLLPAGYTELKYLESSGTQYINTGVLGNYNVYYSTCISPQQIDISQVYIGSEYTIDKHANRIGLGPDSHLFYSQASDGAVVIATGVVPTINKRYLLENGKNSFRVNNTSYSRTYTGSSSKNITILASPMRDETSVYEYCASVKLYSTTIYTDSGYVRDFIPAQINTAGEDVKGKAIVAGTVGLYDIITKKFYTNDGTGTFISGGALVD